MVRALLFGAIAASALLAADVEIGQPQFQSSLPYCGS